MRRSLFAKLLIGYCAITVAFAAVLLLFSVNIITFAYQRQADTYGHALACAACAALAPQLERGDVAALREQVAGLGRQMALRITVVATNGLVLADTDELPAAMDNHAGRPEIAEALRGRAGVSERYSDTVRQQMYYHAAPVMRAGRVVAVVRVSVPAASMHEVVRRSGRNILDVTLAALAVALVAAMIAARRLTRRIALLHDAAGKVAAGDFDARLYLDGADEISELAGTFNDMAARVNALFAQLSGQKDQLRAVIASIQEGLCVVAADDRIALSNESFARISGAPAPAGKRYWEIGRLPALDELVQRARREHTAHSAELQLHDITCLCHVTPLASSDDLVMLWHDITAVNRLEQVRKEFVLNASHELRTPLTAIKGFIETLEDDAALADNRYLQIIKRHTERMIAMVQDLMTLSALEHKGDLDLSHTDLRSLIDDLLKMFERRAQEKGVFLRAQIAADVPAFLADRCKLEQAFINLIDNALKYTDSGGITVTVTQADNAIRIEVADTGAGIPAEHLPHIFQRFYTVDKSRSRKLGGTGLGLAIVKHIVLLHGGRIEARSEPGRGTTFVMTLPLRPAA